MIEIIRKSAGDNYTPRPVGERKVYGVAIHIAQGSEQGTDSHFRNTASDVSSHFMVGLDGEARQYVSVHHDAWTQGRVREPTWPGLRNENPNRYLVSIEHEGYGTTPWPEAQLMTSSLLTAWVFQRFDIEPIELNIVKHSEIFSGKPYCPGVHFHRTTYLERVRWWLRYHNPKTLVNGIF